MGGDDGAKGKGGTWARATTTTGGGGGKGSIGGGDDDEDRVGGKPAQFVPTLLRALRLAKLYYFGDQRVRARTLLAAMLVLCACTTGLMVRPVHRCVNSSIAVCGASYGCITIVVSSAHPTSVTLL